MTVAVATARVHGLVIELHCRRCRQPFTPTADDVRRGPTTYRYCSACRVARDQARQEAAITEVRTMPAALARAEIGEKKS